MQRIWNRFLLHQTPVGRIVLAFLTINLIASLGFILWPLAIPILLAEFCLLVVWAAWGPGDFYRRFLICLQLGILLGLLSQCYIWIVALTWTMDLKILFMFLSSLFSIWLLAQIPLWVMRYLWNWRITNDPDADLRPFSVLDLLVGTTMISIALANLRWSIERLLEEFGPIQLTRAATINVVIAIEVLFLIATAVLTTLLVFRFDSHLKRTIPIVIISGLFALISGWIWFTAPERWIVFGVLWIGGLLLSIAVAIPMTRIRELGYSVYIGRKKLKPRAEMN